VTAILATNQQSPTPPSEPRASLWQAVARSVRDNVIAEFAVQALRLGGFIVLARTLTPADFGLFRVLLVVGIFATLTNEAGIPDALIQRKHVTAAHEATAWWMNVALSLATAALLYITAPTIGALMGMPGLRAGIRLLCLPIMLEGTAVAANARLRRRLHFGVLAGADVVAEVAFITVALLLLWRGMPIWSLPAGLAARFAVHAAAIWVVEPTLPVVAPTREAERDIVGFGATVWSGRIVYTLSSNADYLLVGRLLGSSALGFYSMAWDLLRFVPDRLIGSQDE
jgi:O-antigen/teichoic acid export membrane protein